MAAGALIAAAMDRSPPLLVNILATLDIIPAFKKSSIMEDAAVSC
jgi:hypothetical protein